MEKSPENKKKPQSFDCGLLYWGERKEKNTLIWNYVLMEDEDTLLQRFQMWIL